jgi:hypothetical protein
MTDSVSKTEKMRPGTGVAGPGRPKGVPNKTTQLLKDAILQAANNAGGGGKAGMVKYLTIQATEQPGAFMALLGKVLPVQMAGDPNAPITFTVIERRIVKSGD